MANPLYQQLMGMGTQQPATPVQPQPPMNPFQRMNYILQAMRNPAQFVRNAFPDIPQNIANDPNQILQYLQQTRNISPDQIRQIMNQLPRP